MAEPVDTVAFAEAFEVVREMTLEENERATVVEPTVSSGGEGLLLLAEPLEGQVNLYGTDGGLRTVFGGKGEAPGEFQLPLTAHRAANGDIVVADMMLRRITFQPPGEGDGPEVVASPIPFIVGAQDLGDGRYLLTGADGNRPRPSLLHIWNRESERVERSFLPVGVPEALLPAAATFTASSATLEGDTIWAVWALSDTLYKFDRAGDLLATVPLVLPRPGDFESMTGPLADPRAMQSAFDAVTQVYRVFVLGNGDKVVVSMQTRGFDSVWDILILDRRGEPVWKAANMPRLMTVEDDLFYFRHPGASLPNRWLVARRRGRTVAVGDTIVVPDLSGTGPALVWVFDADECLGCDLTGPARSVRVLQRRFGARLETAVVALSEVGEPDRAMVEAFLESQRVSARVRMRTSGEHSREFGDAPVPAFYIVGADAVVRAVLEPDRTSFGRAADDSPSLTDFIDALAEEPESPEGTQWR